MAAPATPTKVVSGRHALDTSATPDAKSGTVTSLPAVSPLKQRRTPRSESKTTKKSAGPAAAAESAEPTFAWHAFSVEDIFRLLETSPAGLSDAEAARRAETLFGRNTLTPPKKLSLLARVWAQINNILIWILLAAAVVSGVLYEWAEVGLILLVITVNVTIGIVQEGKAEEAAAKLKELLSPTAIAVRDGARKPIDASELVPGDVVFMQSGDRCPADVRLFDISKLQCLEAMLTGESKPVAKNNTPVAPAAPLGDRKCMAFAATLVMSGQALGVVVETGDFTQVGAINALVGGTDSGKTQLTVQLEIFGRWISLIVGIIALSTWLLAYLGRGFTLGESFTSAVAVAVAIIPEGLPAVVTIVLAIGTQAMAAQHAIIKSLPAVETLGSVTVICSDKTGTLTKNEMTAVGVRTGGRGYKVKGVGYAPTGTILAHGQGQQGEEDGTALTDEEQKRLQALLLPGLLCSDADLVAPGQVTQTSGGDGKEGSTAVSTMWTPVGDPTEVAMITVARKAGLPGAQAARSAFPRVASIPFESEHKFMATVHRAGEGNNTGGGREWVPVLPSASSPSCDLAGARPGDAVMFVKGAPDRLLPVCKDAALDSDPTQTASITKSEWYAQAAALSAKGLRVLLVCRAVLPSTLDLSDLSPTSITGGSIPLTAVALIAILDPPRDEAVTAIKVAHTAGIIVKMITGDHRDTALAIGRMLGITGGKKVLAAADTDLSDLPAAEMVFTGPELDAMTDAQLDAIVMECNVFARASPENKIRIVKALQRLGQISSMTGDGVNDAPALKAANIGVAMGITGTDVSKEAAKMVLADDNFATIVAAVEEGRRVWDNLVKILIYNTPVNIAQGMSTFFAYALAMPHPPLTAIATLYVNMITSVAMGMAFAFEPAETDIMTRPPRPSRARLFSTEVLWRNFFVGALMIIAILGTFELALADGATLAEARAEAFSQLILAEAAYVFNCRFLRTTSVRPAVFMGNKWIFFAIGLTVGLQVLIVYTPGLNTFFYCAPMAPQAWGRIIGFAAVIFVIVELEKQVLHYVRPYLSALNHGMAKYYPSFLRLPTAAGTGGASVAGGAKGPLTTTPGPGHAAPASAGALPTIQEAEAEALGHVRFIATSASTFGVPVAPHGEKGRPGEGAHRPTSLSTAAMFEGTMLLAQAQGKTGNSKPGTPMGSPALGALDAAAAGAMLPTLSLTAVAAAVATLPEGAGPDMLPHPHAPPSSPALTATAAPAQVVVAMEAESQQAEGGITGGAEA